jgi:mRNA interferase RelE/StbE
MSFEIVFSTRAIQYLQRVDKPVRIEILKKIQQITENPEVGKPLTNKLKGCYRIRIGKHRVIYTVDKKIINITKIGHRKDVY